MVDSLVVLLVVMKAATMATNLVELTENKWAEWLDIRLVDLKVYM